MNHHRLEEIKAKDDRVEHSHFNMGLIRANDFPQDGANLALSPNLSTHPDHLYQAE